jgi:hypothetical protein
VSVPRWLLQARLILSNTSVYLTMLVLQWPAVCLRVRWHTMHQGKGNCSSPPSECDLLGV